LLQGESELAESETKVVLAVAPDNVLALTTLAQAQAAQRRWPEARATMIRALQCFYASYTAGAADGGDLAGAARMLAALGDDRRLYQLYRHCVRGVAGRWDQNVLTHMGIAAFNMGRHVEARWLWRMALRAEGELDDVLDAFLFTADKVDRGQLPPFPLDHRLHPDTMVPGEAEPPGFVKAFAVRELWRAEDPDARDAALDLLAQMDDPWVADALFHVVRQPDLPDELKMKAGVWLVERGFVDEDEPLEINLDGRLQTVFIEPHGHERPGRGHGRAESALRPYRVGVQDLLDEAVHAHGRGDEDAAEASYRQALALDADCVPALVGLAHVCRLTRREREAERLLVRALSLEPDNAIVLFNLAALLSQQKKDDKARAVLENLKVPELPVEMWPAYYSLIEHLAPAPEPDDASVLHSAARRQARYERQPIDPGWPWDKALARLTLKRLQATAQRLQVKNLWKMRKTELSAAVAARLRHRLRWVWQALGDDERQALRWIDEQGGIVTLERLRERFGADDPVNVDWETEPDTVPMRLQYWGLLFVGRLRGADQPVAVLLEDTRRLLHRLWRRA